MGERIQDEVMLRSFFTWKDQSSQQAAKHTHHLITVNEGYGKQASYDCE